jgi:hypothetical protein
MGVCKSNLAVQIAGESGLLPLQPKSVLYGKTAKQHPEKESGHCTGLW